MTPPPDGKEQEGTVVPWREPSSFEVVAMAKLKTMVPDDVFEFLLWQRETMTPAMFSGLDPEAMRLIDQISEDRVEVLSQFLQSRAEEHKKHRNPG